MAPEITILSHPRCDLKARTQDLIQVPVGSALEVPTGKSCLSQPALSDDLVN
jgi:hypothetical protein